MLFKVSHECVEDIEGGTTTSASALQCGKVFRPQIETSGDAQHINFQTKLLCTKDNTIIVNITLYNTCII